MEKWLSKISDPNNQNRKSVRLDYHDYTKPGYYYITICCHNGIHYFGEVVDDKMVLSPQGKIADDFMRELTDNMDNVEDITYIVMPHHIHLLFYLQNDDFDDDASYTLDSGEIMDTMREVRKRVTKCGSVSSVVRSIKSGITRVCHQDGYEMKWLSRFYDHVVRNSEQRVAIMKYIESNPIHWKYPRGHNPSALAF